MFNDFERVYTLADGKQFHHAVLVQHQGTLVGLAMDEDRRIHYTVQVLKGVEDARNPDVSGWLDKPVALPFPREIARAGYRQESLVAIAQVKGNAFRSTTARLSADAPFFALSSGQDLFLFRQSLSGSAPDAQERIDGRTEVLADDTLLVDRYALVDAALVPRNEVRFQRSRHKTTPLNNHDSLGARDLDGEPFVEPTQRLEMVHNLSGGRFAVQLLPTALPGRERWQIFSFNTKTRLIESFNIERGEDGLFNPAGTRYYTCPGDHKGKVFETRPGLCPRGDREKMVVIDAGARQGNMALRFGSDGAQMRLHAANAPTLGEQWTVEAWIQTPLPSSDEGNALLSCGVEGLQIGMCNHKIGVWQNQQFRTAGDVVPRSKGWHHLAAVASGGEVTFYLDGEAGDGPVKVSGGGKVAFVGNNPTAARPLGGLDELRIWGTARSHDEIRAQMSQRLIGEEPGLLAYWRFDEGQGHTVRDQSRAGHTATLTSAVEWEASQAPVSDHPGVHRDRFELSGCEVASGLAAQLYYQQEEAPSGYTGAEKPIKNAARLMLALAVTPVGGEGRSLATLDFGVSRTGGLTQTPVALSLRALQPGPDGALQLPLLHFDPDGHTVAGGLLAPADGAPADSAPSLLDGGDGRLSLLYRGGDQETEALAAHFDTSTGRTRLRLHTADKREVFLSARVTGPLSPAPTVLIEQDPGSPERLVGALEEPVSGEVEELTLAKGAAFALGRQQRLTLGETAVVTYAAVPAEARRIPLERVALTAAKDTPVRLVEAHGKVTLEATVGPQTITETWCGVPLGVRRFLAVLNGAASTRDVDPDYYNYKDKAWVTVTRDGVEGPRAPLTQGSLLFRAATNSTELGDAVTPEAAELISARTVGTRWVPDAPNHAVQLSNGRALSNRPQTALSATGTQTVHIQGEVLSDSAAFTVEWWLCPSALEDKNCQSLGVPGPWGDFKFHANAAGMIFVGTSGGDDVRGRFIRQIPNQVAVGRWQHFALTRDRDGHAVFYRDGEVLYSMPNMLAPERARWDAFTIGITNEHHFSGIHGLIDEVRVWGAARSAEEIRATRLQRIRAPRPGLAACWSFARDPETKGLVARDHAGRGLHGEVKGEGATLGRSFSLGPPRSALSLGDRATMTIKGDAPILKKGEGGPFTVEWWIYPEALADYTQALGVVTEDANRWGNFLFHAGKDGDVYVGTDMASRIACAKGTLEAKRWQHFALTRDRIGNALFFKDGVPIGHSQVTMAESRGDWNTFTLGDRVKELYSGLQGRIDELRVWSCVRTPAEIADDRHRRIRGPRPGLALCASFDLDARGAPILRDHAGNGRAGEVAGTGAGLGDSFAQATSAGPGSLTFDDDLSMEAWIRPTTFEGSQPQWILQQRGLGRDYTLGLVAQETGSALQINTGGARDALVRCPPGLTSKDGRFTFELWARRLDLSASKQVLLSVGQDPKTRLTVSLDHETTTKISLVQAVLGEQGAVTYFPLEPLEPKWHHIAVRITPGTNGNSPPEIEILVNGTAGQRVSSEVVFDGKGALLIGGSPDESPHFRGQIDDVRVWKIVRTNDQIKKDKDRTLRGDEPNLLANWRFDGLRATDHGPSDLHGVIEGRAANVSRAVKDRPPVRGFAVRASAGQRHAQTAGALPLRPTGEQPWTHVAATFQQSWALRFDGQPETVVDCGDGPTLDLVGDLSVEIWLRLDQVGRHQVLLSRGGRPEGGGQSFGLAVTQNGSILFQFRDDKGVRHEVPTRRGRITTPGLYRLAVVRVNQHEADKSTGKLKTWSNFYFYLNNSPVETVRRDELPAAAPCDARLELGRGWVRGVIAPLRGVLSQVRVWESARKANRIFQPIRGDESSLVGWWRLEEREGGFAYDARGQNHGKLTGTEWVHNPDPDGSSFEISLNGRGSDLDRLDPPAPALPQFTVGALQTQTATEGAFSGQIDELRIWRVARSPSQIRDELFRRLAAEQADLIAYYRFDQRDAPVVRDLSGNGHDLDAGGEPPTWRTSTAPIGEEPPRVRGALGGNRTEVQARVRGTPSLGEYGTLRRDAQGALSGVLKRCASYVQDGQWRLYTGFKIGDLETEWLSQVQYAPQLIGYIEGAPPVPGENMRVRYEGQTELPDYRGASALTLHEAESQTHSYASSTESGRDTQIDGSVAFGVKFSLSWSASAVGGNLVDISGKGGFKHSSENSWSDTTEAQAASTDLSARASSMALHGHWSPKSDGAKRRFAPENTGFALVQSATADLFALRLRHSGALLGFRVLPNPDIPRDWNILTFRINPHYVKQGTLDGRIGREVDPDYRGAQGRGEYSYYKPTEAYALKQRIARERQYLKDQYEQRTPAPGESLPELHRRNLANTYVWTADGGFFAETTETMDAIEARFVTSSNAKWMNGDTTDVSVFSLVGFDLDVSFLYGGHLIQTSSKSATSQTGYSLGVELSLERDLQQYKDKEPEFDTKTGRPVLDPGRVDAYRFMSFYLRPSETNFEEFRNKVVDPTWLNDPKDPRAAALREVLCTDSSSQDEKSQPWRILHRVTYVSRVLPKNDDKALDGADGLDLALTSAGFESHHAVVERLAPYVRGATRDHRTFCDAAREALRRRYPDLVAHEDEIVEELCAWFGVYPTE